MNMAVIVLSALLLLQGADDKKAEDLIRDSSVQWKEILRPTKLKGDTRHYF